MKQRLILAALAALVCAAAVPGNAAVAADIASPRSDRPTSAGAGTLVDKALQAMDGAEEIVFVIRDLSSAYQWYATFGEYADEQKHIYPTGGSRLCRLDLHSATYGAVGGFPGRIPRSGAWFTTAARYSSYRKAARITITSAKSTSMGRASGS